VIFRDQEVDWSKGIARAAMTGEDENGVAFAQGGRSR
jgi:hypothetical protein